MDVTAPQVKDPGWRRRAECSGMDTELFFPERGRGKPRLSVQIADAIVVCHRCPVREDCLAEHLIYRDKISIAGGMTGRARKRMIEDKETAQPDDGRDEIIIEQLMAGAEIPSAAPVDVAHAIVRLRAEQGLDTAVLSHRFGVDRSTIRRYIRRVRQDKLPIDPHYVARVTERSKSC